MTSTLPLPLPLPTPTPTPNQAAYASLHGGRFATEVAPLLHATLCSLQLGKSDTCDLSALLFASDHPEVFTLRMNVTEHAAQLTRECPSRPCFMASVRVEVPASHAVEGAAAEGAAEESVAEGAAPYVYTAFINSNRDTVVRHEDPKASAPCL